LRFERDDDASDRRHGPKSGLLQVPFDKIDPIADRGATLR
jgi:hypothetical protein